MCAFSHEQGPVGPRIPEGNPYYEDPQWDAGVFRFYTQDKLLLCVFVHVWILQILLVPNSQIMRGTKKKPCSKRNVLMICLFASFHVPRPATAAPTVAVRFGCVTVMDM